MRLTGAGARGREGEIGRCEVIVEGWRGAIRATREVLEGPCTIGGAPPPPRTWRFNQVWHREYRCTYAVLGSASPLVCTGLFFN